NTSPFFNWLIVRGSAIHEAGPFTDQDLHSRDLSASIEFEVGRPWGRNAFITGYSVRDELFRPVIREYFTTSTWAGLQHKFGQRFTLTGLGKYIRSWRVVDLNFAIAQIMMPGVRVNYKANDRWEVTGSFDFTRGEGFHLYDNTQGGFLVTYTKPLRRSVDYGAGGMAVDYPLRISAGVQQEKFFTLTRTGETFLFPSVNPSSLF